MHCCVTNDMLLCFFSDLLLQHAFVDTIVMLEKSSIHQVAYNSWKYALFKNSGQQKKIFNSFSLFDTVITSCCVYYISLY